MLKLEALKSPKLNVSTLLQAPLSLDTPPLLLWNRF
jgi:hypothetical protein